MMSDELKPCPFCGSEHIIVWNPKSENHKYLWGYHVRCDDCGGGIDQCDDRADAVAAWNTRVDGETTASPSLRATIRQIVAEMLGGDVKQQPVSTVGGLLDATQFVDDYLRRREYGQATRDILGRAMGDELKTIRSATTKRPGPLYIQVTSTQTYQGSATWLANLIISRHEWVQPADDGPWLTELIADLIVGWCGAARRLNPQATSARSP